MPYYVLGKAPKEKEKRQFDCPQACVEEDQNNDRASIILFGIGYESWRRWEDLPTRSSDELVHVSGYNLPVDCRQQNQRPSEDDESVIQVKSLEVF